MTQERNIYLVGLMGAGKTTLGKSLAKRLARPFVDSDQEVEKRTGVPVRTIFDLEGEEGFRKREAQAIAELASQDGMVIATGGGAVLNPDNRRCLNASGFVVYLNASPGVLFSRLRHDKTRPLLQVPDPLARLESLFAQRDPLYREVADLVIDCSRNNPGAALQAILRELDYSPETNHDAA